MGRIYSVTFTAAEVGTAAQDLFQLEPVGIPIKIIQIVLSQSSDFGDAEAENPIIKINRITDTVSSVVTPAPVDPGDNAAVTKANINQTSQLVTGIALLHVEAWNIALPFNYVPIPETRLAQAGDDAITITIGTTADALTMHGVVYFEEFGA